MFKVQVKAIDSETVYRGTHHNNTGKAFFHCMRPFLRSRQLAKGYVENQFMASLLQRGYLSPGLVTT